MKEEIGSVLCVSFYTFVFSFRFVPKKRNSPYCGGPPANRLCFRKTNHCRHAERCENVTKAGVFRRRFLCFFPFLQGFSHYFIDFQCRNSIDFRQNVCYNMRTGGHFLSLTVGKTEIPRFSGYPGRKKSDTPKPI